MPETRKPATPAVISEIDGVVKWANWAKGLRKIYVESEDGRTQKEYRSSARNTSTREGEHVKAGEPLIDGPLNPHDLLAVLGENTRRPTWSIRSRKSTGLQGVNINHASADGNHRSPDDALGSKS